ncbi:unnamed protein product [Calicophoron daubneyi]|uniref:MADS-box domain-containing protein n=1 Tax=Calicophoron daubneyi TaxID=300641 RepID=A0AAV2TY00_CALDB
MGRKKIQIKAIKDEKTRLVTFAKRRHGLFKKAYELSVLCECEIALIVFTRSNRLYQYASINMDQAIDRRRRHPKASEFICNSDMAAELDHRRKSKTQEREKTDGQTEPSEGTVTLQVYDISKAEEEEEWDASGEGTLESAPSPKNRLASTTEPQSWAARTQDEPPAAQATDKTSFTDVPAPASSDNSKVSPPVPADEGPPSDKIPLAYLTQFPVPLTSAVPGTPNSTVAVAVGTAGRENGPTPVTASDASVMLMRCAMLGQLTTSATGESAAHLPILLPILCDQSKTADSVSQLTQNGVNLCNGSNLHSGTSLSFIKVDDQVSIAATTNTTTSTTSDQAEGAQSLLSTDGAQPIIDQHLTELQKRLTETLLHISSTQNSLLDSSAPADELTKNGEKPGSAFKVVTDSNAGGKSPPRARSGRPKKFPVLSRLKVPAVPYTTQTSSNDRITPGTFLPTPDVINELTKLECLQRASEQTVNSDLKQLKPPTAQFSLLCPVDLTQSPPVIPPASKLLDPFLRYTASNSYGHLHSVPLPKTPTTKDPPSLTSKDESCPEQTSILELRSSNGALGDPPIQSKRPKFS